jgi:hypothetical protein
MKDTELDRLLNTWEAPTPPPSMRQRLRARFPRAERPGFGRPMKWALVGLCSLGLTIAIAQTGESHGDAVMGHLNRLYEGLVMMVDSHRAVFVRDAIRESQPRVYVDGQPGATLEYRGGASLWVHVPGDGVYGAIFVRYVDHFSPGREFPLDEAGRVHDNVVEFQAAGKQFRIECNRPIIDGELPVFVLHRPE